MMKIVLFICLLIGLAVGEFAENREHRVHNIVLYPDKQSWCETQNVSQVISYPGCKQVTIDNNVCVGGCFSYSIPHTEPSDPGEIIVPYCDSCQPSETAWHDITLDCSEDNSQSNGGDEESKPAVMVKRVQIIKNCSCTACEKQQHHKKHNHNHHQDHHNHQDHHGSPVSHSTQGSLIQDDIPELLEVVPYSENDTELVQHSPVHSHQTGNHGTYLEQHHLNHYVHHSHTDNVKKLLHQKISTLMKNIEESDTKHDREQLVEMIKLIKGSSDRNWDDLIGSLQSENSIVDFERLRAELEVEEEAPEFHPKPNSAEQQDHNLLLKHQFDVTRQHPTHALAGDHQGHHRDRHHQNNNHHHHQHHGIGERVDGHHHLERGPHGSLVAVSDEEEFRVAQLGHEHEIKEKINIHPHELKPNHVGTVLTYDNHHSDRKKETAGVGAASATGSSSSEEGQSK
ncbi:histidine-rich glycoprotein-like isoform X2 [Uranotaenia lowii]|nr:histidine-rich glycoprotein-like isoform X2 [Uranotaenia lowii]XP_055586039.1 histidine-rich glycoprotein-like isoform X2 [Uranotaenia lowii]XP_055586040.1 histidine-rich glycoprotein-like isoform X2 [Uranotaenia lowii]